MSVIGSQGPSRMRNCVSMQTCPVQAQGSSMHALSPERGAPASPQGRGRPDADASCAAADMLLKCLCCPYGPLCEHRGALPCHHLQRAQIGFPDLDTFLYTPQEHGRAHTLRALLPVSALTDRGLRLMRSALRLPRGLLPPSPQPSLHNKCTTQLFAQQMHASLPAIAA